MMLMWRLAAKSYRSAGIVLPVQYGAGVIAEHMAVRTEGRAF